MAALEQVHAALSERRPLLAQAYAQALRQAVFDNRADARPAQLRALADSEADAVLRFFAGGDCDDAGRHADALCRAGLTDEVFLRLVSTGAVQLRALLPEPLAADALVAFHRYQEAALTRFARARQQQTLDEQERIRAAVQRTLNRSTVQMEVAAEVARAATSVPEFGDLLRRVVEMIRQPFGFHRVAVWLVDEAKQTIVLRAVTDGPGAPPLGEAVDLSPATPVGACILGGEPRLSTRPRPGGAAFVAELVVPLPLRDHVAGAIAVEGTSEAAFSDQEVGALCIVSGQLAKALENALLFAELEERVQQRTAELSQANAQLRQEIAERKRTEEALSESELRFRSVAQTANDAIVCADQAGSLVYWNRGAEAMFGYSATEARGLPLADLVPQRLREPLASLGALVGRTVELRGYRKDGREFPLELSLATWQTEAGTFYSAIIRDLTERRASERVRVERTRAVEHAKALEYSNRELEQFAFTASHDLQEPLRKIQAFADRLKVRYAPVLDAQGQDYLARMQGAAARMQQLINDLLTYSRVTTRALPFVPVDLNEVARGVAADLEVRIEQTGGSLEFGALPTVDADPTQMRQLLQNLVGNALKFHKKDVAPVVKVTCEVLSQLPEAHLDDEAANACRLVVEDNGIGIEEKYLERIFVVFQRLHGRGEYEGTGVGLAVCRRIAERHNGSIVAHSQPGVGSRFIVTLPVRQQGAGGPTP